MTMAERIARFAPPGTTAAASGRVASSSGVNRVAADVVATVAVSANAAPRIDTPVVRNEVRGGSSAALTGLNNDGLDVLVRELEGGRFARSAAAPRASF